MSPIFPISYRCLRQALIDSSRMNIYRLISTTIQVMTITNIAIGNSQMMRYVIQSRIRTRYIRMKILDERISNVSRTIGHGDASRSSENVFDRSSLDLTWIVMSLVIKPWIWSTGRQWGNSRWHEGTDWIALTHHWNHSAQFERIKRPVRF